MLARRLVALKEAAMVRFVPALSRFAAAAIAMSAAIVFADATPYFEGPDPSKMMMSNVAAAQADFLSQLSDYGIEDLESLSGSDPTLLFDGYVTGETGFSNGVNSFALYSVSGSNFLWDTEGDDDYIEFESPITAFGAYIVQGGDGSSLPPTSAPANEFSITIEDTTSSFSELVPIADLGPDWAFFNVIFVGVTSETPFNRVSFSESYDYDGLLFDDLIAGDLASLQRVAAVPEPTSLALIGASLMAVGVVRRRRR
jgi:hypothetical protein